MQRVDDKTGAPLSESMGPRASIREWLIGHVIARDALIMELLDARDAQALRLEALDALVQALYKGNPMADTPDDLAARVTELESWRSEFALEIKPAIWRELGLLDDKIVETRYVPVWRRVWALVTGR